MPPSIQVPTEVVDMETGETTSTHMTPFHIMPPLPEACQVCGRNPPHEPEEPHDATSLYYQYLFYAEHQRWPTWKDALAHCTPHMQAEWERVLRSMGKWSEPEETPDAVG